MPLCVESKKPYTAAIHCGFVVHQDPLFPCVQSTRDRWTVTVPALTVTTGNFNSRHVPRPPAHQSPAGRSVDGHSAYRWEGLSLWWCSRCPGAIVRISSVQPYCVLKGGYPVSGEAYLRP